MRGWASIALGTCALVACSSTPAHEVVGTTANALTVSAEREIDPAATGTSAATGDQSTPSIVSLGANQGYLAVWYDRRGSRPGIYGTRIGSDGRVLDDTGIQIASGVGYTSPSLAVGTNGALVTWAISYVDPYQQPGVYAVRLDLNANVLDAAPIVVAPNAPNAQLAQAAFGGGEWLVAWSTYGSTTSNDIVGVRLSAAGMPVDAAPIPIANTATSEYNSRVIFDGTNFFVWYRENQAVLARFFGLDGKQTSGPITLVPATSINDVSVDFANGIYTVVWSEYVPANPGTDIRFRRFTAAGAAIDLAPVSLTNDATADDAPRVAFDGANEVVTWYRGNTQLVAQRINVDGAPITIANGTYYGDYQLASDRGGSVAVNREYSGSSLIANDIKGVRFGTTPGAASQFLVSKAANAETQPSIAWTGSAYLATWLDTRSGQAEIWGARLAADGTPQLPQKLFSEPSLAELTRPRIASDGDGALVVFYSNSSVAPQKRGIRAIRIDNTAKADAAGPFDIAFVPQAQTPFQLDTEPDIAFDGANYLVVWQQQTNDAIAISGTRIAQNGKTPLDTPLLRISPRDPNAGRSAPAIGFDGQNHFVAWITTRPTANSIAVTHIAGSRIGKEGSVLDGEIDVCTAFLLQRAPSVAGDPKLGGFMVAWEDYRNALDTADVYGARISPSGQNLDGPNGMKIATGPQDESAPRVSAAGDGANFVVSWRDIRSKTSYDLYGAWISRAGTNHDPDGLAIAKDIGDEESPSIIASSDTKLLAVYQRLDPNLGYGSYRVRARSIDGGSPIAAPCATNDDCASRSCADGVCCSTECGGCGVCNVTPGTCTPRAAESEAATCPAYKCKGAITCPSRCDTDADCATSSTCDPNSHQCVSRIICIDDHTLKDLTGKQTECAPFKCTGDACRTQCGSVDDCASGFVCDLSARCVPAPDGGDTGGCSTSGGNSSSMFVIGLGWVIAALVRKRVS